MLSLPQSLALPPRAAFWARPENLWVLRCSQRVVEHLTPYEIDCTEAVEALTFSRSVFQTAMDAIPDSAELSTAAGGHRSRRTSDRRGGQLVFSAQAG